MHRPRRSSLRVASALLALALAAACTDRSNPVAPAPGDGPGDEPPGEALTIQTITCVVQVRARDFSCGPTQPATGSASADIDVTGQNVFIKLTSSNIVSDTIGGTFTMDVTVKNLIPQPLGTADGVTPSPGGVRVLFASNPVTSGPGSVYVAGARTGIFPDLARLESAHPGISTTPRDFYRYDTILDQNETSAPQRWQFNYTARSGSFSFAVVVLAAVPFPRGYVDITGGASTVRSGADLQLNGVVRDSVGQAVTGKTITWGVSDTRLARVDATGKAHGLRAGPVRVTAQSEIQPGVFVPGTFAVTVEPVRRVWTGATGGTDWSNGANWLPDSIAPVASDTAVVSSTLTPPGANYPALTTNTFVGGLEVHAGSVSLSVWDLNASGDVLTTGGAFVASTLGRLRLTGSGRTVRGLLPWTQVEGSYTQDGDLSIRAPGVLQLGNLTNPGYGLTILSQ